MGSLIWSSVILDPYFALIGFDGNGQYVSLRLG